MRLVWRDKKVREGSRLVVKIGVAGGGGRMGGPAKARVIRVVWKRSKPARRLVTCHRAASHDSFTSGQLVQTTVNCSRS